jgi:hypothetical protein
MREKWKKLNDFPKYRIYKNGQIWSEITNRFLKPLRTPNGYLHVVLTNPFGKKRMAIHRAICEAFYGKPSHAYAVAHHKNGIRHDNHAENLEWCMQSDNVKYGYTSGGRILDEAHRQRAAALGRLRRKLTAKQAELIREEYTGKWGQLSALAAKYGIDRSSISAIVRGCAYLGEK